MNNISLQKMKNLLMVSVSLIHRMIFISGSGRENFSGRGIFPGRKDRESRLFENPPRG
jgi:hypothetical protein